MTIAQLAVMVAMLRFCLYFFFISSCLGTTTLETTETEGTEGTTDTFETTGTFETFGTGSTENGTEPWFSTMDYNYTSTFEPGKNSSIHHFV